MPAGLAAPDLEHAGLGQHLDRLAQGRAADLHARGKLALGGEAVAHVQVAGLDLLRDLLDGLLEGAPRGDRFEVALQTGASIWPVGGRDAGDHVRADATRSSAWRSATSTGVEPSASAVAIARSRQSMARSTRSPSSGPSWPYHSLGHVDEAAAVGEEVGHVEDAATRQRPRDLAAGERVVGGAGHHAAVDRAPERVVDHAAGGAGSDHVERHGEHRLGRRRHPDPVLGRAALRPRLVEVAGHHVGARAGQPRGQRVADLAEAHHAHAPVARLVGAGGGAETAADRLEDRLGGDGGGVAAAASLQRAADDVGGVARHQVHVGGGGADVLRGDVGAVQLVDHAGGLDEAGIARVGAGRRRSSRPCRRRATGRRPRP